MEYLYEMHAHTVEISTCAVSTAPEMVDLYRDTDYYGIVLTNHINDSTFRKVGLTDAPWDEKMDHFLSGYEILKQAAGDRFKVILAMEICFYCSPNDYLVYGVTEEFLRSHGDLMAMTPKQFSRLARENGILFLQAHPFRRGLQVEDWNILDGYEVFNGNPRHDSSNDFAALWAKKHNKDIVVSGSDFHEPGDSGIGGIYFQKPIETPEELVEELRSGNYRLKIPTE